MGKRTQNAFLPSYLVSNFCQHQDTLQKQQNKSPEDLVSRDIENTTSWCVGNMLVQDSVVHVKHVEKLDFHFNHFFIQSYYYLMFNSGIAFFFFLKQQQKPCNRKQTTAEKVTPEKVGQQERIHNHTFQFICFFLQAKCSSSMTEETYSQNTNYAGSKNQILAVFRHIISMSPSTD